MNMVPMLPLTSLGTNPAAKQESRNQDEKTAGRTGAFVVDSTFRLLAML
jgi:hypothetical protein